MRDTTAEKQELVSRDFLLLFGMCLCSNCYLAIFYCFEQWLDGLSVSPGWTGALLGAMFAAFLVARPMASVFMLSHSRLVLVVLSIVIISLGMVAYQFVPWPSPAFVWIMLALRLVQGFFMAVFSACTVAAMVNCIPPGQSARGIAIFSLTNLLPFALMPSVGELLIPVLGGEAKLFAATSIVGIPALIMTFLLAPKLRHSERDGTPAANHHAGFRDILRSVGHSGLGIVQFAVLLFGLTTNIAIFFIKGLSTITGYSPAHFFLFYTGTIMVLRVLSNRHMDRMPRAGSVAACSLVMGAALACISWGPQWSYIPATILYGAGITLIYPLHAAIIIDNSTPDMRSINTNVMMLMFDLARMFAPLFGGMVLSVGMGYREVFGLAIILQVACGVFTVLDWAVRRWRRA